MTLIEFVGPRPLHVPPIGAPTLQKLALRRRFAFLGPAFVAAVAYVDPGNFATNFGAGATLGYTLVWVLLLANFMAMEVQYLSAKIGVATGKTLPQLCREAFGKKTNAMLWLQAEAVAIATDLAEFVGAALALYLLFGVPMPIAGLITAVVAFMVLACQKRGCRRFELVITASLGFIFAGLIYDFLVAGPVSPSGFAGGLIPNFGGAEGLALAVGIIGATVMPHAIYVHSALSKDHQKAGLYNEGTRDQRLRSLRLDCAFGLGFAGIINLSMLLTAAVLFHGTAVDASSLEAIHAGFGQLVGGGAALAFAVALLASGLSSSSVGTYSGQVVMEGFIGKEISLFLRRGITMAPALVVLCLGLPVTEVLILSQIALSFGIPLALVPLILITRNKKLMGKWANRRSTTISASVITAVIVVLNGILIVSTLA